ncbi:Pyridoxal-phosphate-dependent serine hydroxymethyltransferase [Serratia rubidaea]|uniref:Pyridoxal-phosphate-dependent serine hydroxymethyltransferase n=1 Tax=Serratia rubidaea TaxID=61652 RepID=A0A447QH94_SERRU|nr:Pyridoxal-phosphate-dependent serine hydroxymethyltransferase [Serratia rubidaea]
MLSESARWVGQSRHYDRYYFNGLLNDDCRYAAHYNGMQFEAFPEVAWLQAEATAAAQRLFDAPYIEYRALSGVHCTLAMIAALTEPGDGVWSLSPACGGHFATAALVERLGRRSGFITLTDDGEIDLAALASMLRQPPAAVVLDHGLTCHGFAVAPLRQWLDRHGLTEVLILYDASHPLGLIAGGALANPLDDGADILQGNTHKSFPGPHRAIIATRNASLAARIQGGWMPVWCLRPTYLVCYSYSLPCGKWRVLAPTMRGRCVAMPGYWGSGWRICRDGPYCRRRPICYCYRGAERSGGCRP